MKYLLHLLLVLTFTPSFAQIPKNTLHLGTVDSVYSKKLNEKRKIFIYTPQSFNDKVPGGFKYPVVYLIDPEAHFYSVAGIIRESSENGTLPEMIVVGITNTDRTRDLTPTHVEQPFYHDKVMGWGAERIKTSGGGENFTAFIEKELMPHIDSLYPTAPYRILIGHSFGGLTVINTLFNHPNLFNAHIAIDPALWWDDQKLAKQAEKALVKQKFDNKTLFMAIANVMPVNMDTIQVRKDTTPYTQHTRTILQLNDALNKYKQNKLHYNSKYYPDDDHGSVPVIATYDGLRFIFSYYALRLQNSFMKKIKYNLDSVFTVHFNNVSKAMGYTVLPPMYLVNGYGYYLLSLKNFKQAYTLFQRNIDNYPNSYFVYDGMGDYYNEIGEKEKAIEFYEKTLSLFDFQETKTKLEKLKAGK